MKTERYVSNRNAHYRGFHEQIPTSQRPDTLRPCPTRHTATFKERKLDRFFNEIKNSRIAKQSPTQGGPRQVAVMSGTVVLGYLVNGFSRNETCPSGRYPSANASPPTESQGRMPLQGWLHEQMLGLMKAYLGKSPVLRVKPNVSSLIP